MATSSPSVQMEIRLATEKFLGELKNLESQYEGAMKSVASDTDVVGKSLEQSFKVLGIKSVQAVEQEIKQLQAALAQIRNAPDVLPADKAAAVAAFNKRLVELRGEAQQTPPALAGVGNAADKTGTSLASAAHKAVAWTAALAGLHSAGDVVGQLVATGAEFENLRVRLENLLGGTEKAQTAFDMIKKLAASTPFEVTGLTESFVKLTAMGLQPTEAQMRSLSDVAANLGGGTEVLAGVTTALGQAWAKGKLQGEEIMQLAERGVPVWDALAKATGRSVPELQRMSEAGTLGRDVISKLIDELGRMNAGASDKLMNTYAGAVSNAKDALSEFYDMVAKSGVLEFLTGKLKELLAEFDRMKQTGELETKAKAIADTFISVAMGVETAVKALVSFGPQIKLVVEAAVALKAANMAGALLSIASGALAAGTGMAAAGTASAASAGQMATAGAAATGLATAMRVLRSLTGIGLVVGVAELAQEFLRAKRAAEEGDAAVKKMLEEKPVNGPKKAAEAATAAITQTVSKSDDLIKQFNVLVEKGDTAAEALGKIGKDFDLSSAPGIRDAAVVLDNLVGRGKLTAEQFRDAWAVALKDVNLNDFELRARKALDGTWEGVGRLQQALDAGLREAIRRAGGDFDVLAGGMGKAAKSAVADIDFIIGNLERLKTQGVDTSAALVQSLGKAISTADSQAAIDALRTRIEAVRATLGDKIADGLLDQAKEKAEALKDAIDKATPGINRAREAMKQLGITSDEELKKVAASTKEAYDTLTADGTRSARELAEAFKKAAEAAIAANNGVAPAWVEAQAATRGYKVEVDAAGKATVVAMDGAKGAVKAVEKAVIDVSAALKQMGIDAATASQQVKDLAAAGQMLAAAEQARRDAYNKDLEASKFMNRGNMNPVDSVPAFESKEQADAWLAEWEKQYAKNNPFTTKTDGFQRQTTRAEWQAEVDALALRNTMKGKGNASESSQTPLESMRSGATYVSNITIPGVASGTQIRYADAASQSAGENLLRQLAQAKGASI